MPDSADSAGPILDAELLSTAPPGAQDPGISSDVSPPDADADTDTDTDTDTEAVAAESLPLEPRPTYDELEVCSAPVEEAAGWLDRGHSTIYQTVCGTVAWFDGFFGDKRFDAASRETYGRVSLSGFWDQRDGFDPKLRFRAKLALPALKDRANLMIGRGDDRDFIEERETPSDSIPSNFNGVDDDSFLIGLGYRRGTGLKRGMSFSVGVKLRVPPQPYVKAKYRRAWELSNATLLRARPLVYWKSDEGFGSTLGLDLDHLLSDRFMVRWSGSVNVSEDKEVEGVAWSNWFSLFQALSGRDAISYHTFVLGETKAEVGTQNFGAEIRYRKRIARKWLFMEIINSVSWPRLVPEETRKFNYGIGIGFEMFFGPVPDAQLR